MTKKKWIWIVVGLLAAAVLTCAGFVGTMVYLATRHLEVRQMSAASMEREFEQTRARFAGKAPMIEIDEDSWDRPRVHRSPPSAASKKPETLRVMAWDDQKQKLIRLDLPMWLIRLNPRGRFVHLPSDQFGDFERMELTADDIDRNGPGLILDYRSSRGPRILVWTE